MGDMSGWRCSQNCFFLSVFVLIFFSFFPILSSSILPAIWSPSIVSQGIYRVFPLFFSFSPFFISLLSSLQYIQTPFTSCLYVPFHIRPSLLIDWNRYRSCWWKQRLSSQWKYYLGLRIWFYLSLLLRSSQYHLFILSLSSLSFQEVFSSSFCLSSLFLSTYVLLPFLFILSLHSLSVCMLLFLFVSFPFFIL